MIKTNLKLDSRIAYTDNNACLETETPETLKNKVQILEGKAFVYAIKLYQSGKINKSIPVYIKYNESLPERIQ